MRPSITRQRLLTTSCIAILVLCLLPTASFAGKEPKKRIAVADFVNEARRVHYQWGDLGGGMAEKLVEALIETDKFVVLERQALADVLAEQNLGNVANVEPAVIGRLTSAQALIRGVITNVEAGDGEEGGTKIGKKYRVNIKNQRVSVTVNLRIIDTVTGQILQSKTVEGIAKIRGLRVRKSDGSDFKMTRNHPIGKAMDDAIAQAVADIVDGMESVPWQGSLSRVSGRQVIINAGYQENVEPGLELKVFEKGAEIIDKDTNESLGRLDEEIGLIRVVRVEPRFSVAEVVQGQGFTAGNIIRQVATVP